MFDDWADFWSFIKQLTPSLILACVIYTVLFIIVGAVILGILAIFG